MLSTQITATCTQTAATGRSWSVDIDQKTVSIGLLRDFRGYFSTSLHSERVAGIIWLPICPHELYIKTLQLLFPLSTEPADEDPLQYKQGSKLVRAVHMGVKFQIRRMQLVSQSFWAWKIFYQYRNIPLLSTLQAERNERTIIIIVQGKHIRCCIKYSINRA